MTISISTRAMLTMKPSGRQIAGTLGEQLLRFLSLNREQRRGVAITVASGIALPDGRERRTLLDAEAIRELASDMAARGLI
jgi:hypothetical protein